MVNYAKIKDTVLHAKRPLYFFDDDPDGLCSFITLYRITKEGKGIVLKSRPLLDTKFIAHVQDYDPDIVFVLDIATMSDDFAAQVTQPIHWIDHHGKEDPPKGVHYYNPRRDDDTNICTTALCWNAVGGKSWIAGVGSVADWMLVPNIIKTVQKEYPSLLGEVHTPEQALYETPLGKLVRIFSFALKGPISEVKKNIKILTRIEEPNEILDGKTPAGKFILKHYKKVNKEYDALLKKAETCHTDDPVLEFIYPEDKTSFTSDLSNELLYKHPDKVILVGRKKDGEYRMSLRNAGKKMLNATLPKLLNGLEGYGGGHEHAVGCCVKAEDYNEFLERLRKAFS